MMIATVLSQAEDLFVVREERSSLPSLSKQGPFAHENVVLVAQMAGEVHSSFVSRVTGRMARGRSEGRQIRAAVLGLGESQGADVIASRQRLVGELARALASRSDGELLVVAPPHVSATERIKLFALVEFAMRIAPKLQVRLSFTEAQEKRRPQQSRQSRWGFGQSAQA